MHFVPTILSHLPFLAVSSTAGDLPWAVPQLQNNSVIVILIIIFAVVDLLACHPKGMMLHQLAWLADTRNARTFEASAIVYPWLKPILLVQLFLFTSLSFFCAIDDAPAVHLSDPDLDTWLRLGGCIIAPVVLYCAQHIGYNWFCYLFRAKYQQIIMNRTYQAALILLSPIATLIFIGTMAGSFSNDTTLILLAVLFILSQIVFIFSGFKIFCVNFYALCFIIVYLCTLEIAPIAIICAKLSTQL